MAGAVDGELLGHWLCVRRRGFLERHSVTAIYIAHLYRDGLPATAKANGDGIIILNAVS